MTRVKICGLTRMEDIEAVNRCRPDYAGFVFAPSRRQVSMDLARLLTEALDAPILSVGVFVDEDAARVVDIAKQCALGAVQLHGNEDNAYISTLRKLLPTGTLVIKAIRVRDEASLAQAEQLQCDLLLLDAFTQGQAGGAGKAFDWRLLNGFNKPYLLAGGLHAGNAAGAIETLNPFGVDVSTGVETNGLKDGDKIAQFISIARRECT